MDMKRLRELAQIEQPLDEAVQPNDIIDPIMELSGSIKRNKSFVRDAIEIAILRDRKLAKATEDFLDRIIVIVEIE